MPFFQILELGNTYMYANALHLSICKFILVLLNTSYKMLKNTRLENPYKQKKIQERLLLWQEFYTVVQYCQNH